jgi:hypothetical protein
MPYSGKSGVAGGKTGPNANLPEAFDAEEVITAPVLDMKVLVVTRAGDADGVRDMVTGYLGILGIPYQVIDTSQPAPAGTIEPSDLSDGASRGYYYAVFITTSNIWAALSAAEKSTLAAYERAFGVREVTWYAYPNAVDYGLVPTAVTAANNDPVWCPGTPSGIPFNATLTAEGQNAFSYLRPDLALSIEGPCMYGYLGQPAAGADVTPLMVAGNGDTFLAVYRPGDGRELLVMTEGSFYPAIPPAYGHAQVLPYGIINWATKGLFLGERRLYFVPQPDDVLGWGDRWDPVTHSYIFDTGYRNGPEDLVNLERWLTDFRSRVPNGSGLRVEMPFNGDGVESDVDANGQVIAGTLSAKAMELQGAFTWLNHTLTHRDLDIDESPYPGYQISTNEIASNTATAARLGLGDYSTATLLTGDYSGIAPPNPELAQAAYDQGIRYMLVNASLAGYNNPTPNTGIPHPNQPAILQLPRYANNIFYAVTTPEEETDLYNWIYCPGYAADPVNTPRCYDYEAVLDSVTNQALRFMLDYSVNATMFHMNNFEDYGGGRTVMGDFTEQLYAKYNALFAANVPVLSLRTQEIGQKMRDRMAYNASGVSAQLACGDQITVSASLPAVVPITGIDHGAHVETYAGQTVSYLSMGANEQVVIPGSQPVVAAAITGLAGEPVGEPTSLTWPALMQAADGSLLAAAEYRVYASDEEPYFTPTGRSPIGATGDTEFIDGRPGSAGGLRTYVVAAVGNNCWKRESEPSNRIGRIDYTVYAGEQP